MGFIRYLKWGVTDMFSTIYGAAFFIMFLEFVVYAVWRG